jgi:hypothetical protein
MDNFEKLTEENMKEYTKFSKACHDYAEFLLKKRKVEYNQANETMFATMLSALAQESE